MAAVDPATGYCPETKTYHSLRPVVPLPPANQPLSLTQYAFSLLQTTDTPPSTTTFLVNATTGRSLSYSAFLSQTRSLSHSLLDDRSFSLSPNDVVLIVSPPSLLLPVLYFSLLSLGVTISPTNPLASDSELAHQVRLCNPKLAFATSATASKLPPSLPVVLVDSPEFLSLLTAPVTETTTKTFSPSPEVDQSSPAAILYSSGTTGRVKGVCLTHRNLIALIAGMFHNAGEKEEGSPRAVSFMTIPVFHVFGFFMMVRAAAGGETLVLTERFEFEGMLAAVEKYRVTYMPVSPPLVVALVKSELTRKYDLSSLTLLGSGGAPLGKDVAESFCHKFPNVQIVQGYGLTETGGAATRMVGPEEASCHGSVGRLSEFLEAKIVDPATGEALPPGHRGELWLRGPTTMKGYVGDQKATAETIDSDGWLKTGDLCYFDSQGFLYIVDRLKELIKYNAYQVPPAELEQLLQSNPEIVDAAVIPYPDEAAGEIPMAYVVRKPGSKLTEAQVMDYIAKQVAPYKKIRKVAFVSSIPKSPAGKILRRELINHALSSPSSKL